MTLWTQFEAADKLWQILEMALEDFKIAEKKKNVAICMGAWCERATRPRNQENDKPDNWKGCYVCLAGSVLFRRKGIVKDLWRLPNDIFDKMDAINYMRTGHLILAYYSLYKRNSPPELQDFGWVSYSNKRVFHSTMKKILKVLKGLDV